MKNTIVGILTLLIIITFFSDVNAQKKRMTMDRSHRGFDQLNLTEDQQKKVDDLRLTHKEQMIDLRAELDKSRIENQKLRRSINFSREDLLNQTRKMNEIRNRIAESRANHFMDIYQLLDDEQKKVWSSLKHDRMVDKRIDRKSVV